MQSRKVDNLDGLVEQLMPYLKRYLDERNVDINERGFFRCINPDHDDKNPSCSLVKDSNETIFHCFSCGAKGSIVHAAHFLEDKPIRGNDFVIENVLYLADKYGLQYDEIELSPEELYVHRVYSAYKDAAELISEYQPVKYITKRNWPVSLCRELEIGGVRSYEEFSDKMKARGYEQSFIEEIDINKRIFNEGMLIFSIKDEKGRVVGFSGRDMSHTKGSKKGKFINTSGK